MKRGNGFKRGDNRHMPEGKVDFNKLREKGRLEIEAFKEITHCKEVGLKNGSKKLIIHKDVYVMSGDDSRIIFFKDGTSIEVSNDRIHHIMRRKEASMNLMLSSAINLHENVIKPIITSLRLKEEK